WSCEGSRLVNAPARRLEAGGLPQAHNSISSERSSTRIEHPRTKRKVVGSNPTVRASRWVRRYTRRRWRCRIAAIAPGCKPGTDRYRRFESCRRHVKPTRRLSPDKYNDNQRAYVQRIGEIISKIGFSATHVFSPDGQSSGGFIYTIGLTDKNLPELRISQFHHLLAGEVIGQLAPQIIAEHANRFATAEGAAACLAAGEGYDVDIQEDGQPP